MALLIDKIEIANHRQISTSVRDDKINPYIEDAELLDLRKMLGKALYNDISINPTKATNVELLNGKTWQDDAGNSYQFVGLKKILSILAYARYIKFGSFTDTGFGYVQKSTQDSTPVPETSKRDNYTKERQTANEYFQDVKEFLDYSSDLYPLWNAHCGKRHGFNNIRISKITR